MTNLVNTEPQNRMGMKPPTKCRDCLKGDFTSYVDSTKFLLFVKKGKWAVGLRRSLENETWYKSEELAC